MRYALEASLLAISLFFSQIINSAELNNNYVQTWAGVEVMGVNLEAAQNIRKQMPFKKGSNYNKSELSKYLLTCRNIVKEKIGYDAQCSTISYGNGNVYLSVDILPSKNNSLYRKIPQKEGEVAKLPKKLQNLYDVLNDRFEFLITTGNFPIEKIGQNYKDFEDPKLHATAKKLSRCVPRYNDILLDIIQYSQDDDEREKAAELFSWSRNINNLFLILNWDILLDPDEGVRNNIARSFAPILPDIKDKALLTNLISVYCKQASFSSHLDRNKALLSILKILEKNKELTSDINDECQGTIRYINEMSILENSGGFAKKIITIVDNSKNA